MKRTLIEAISVAAAGIAAGLALHSVRDDGVRLDQAPPPSGQAVCGQAPAAPRAPRWIAIEDASALMQDPSIVFVDSRPRAEFVEGHIAGAINLPRGEAWSAADMARLRGARTVISYCDGTDACSCSSSLADALVAAGIGDVRVLEGGVESWLASGLPGEGGSCPTCPE